MMSAPSVLPHIGKLLLALAAAALAGWLTGFPAVVPALFLACYLAWHAYHAFRLYRFLQKADGVPPKSFGMWNEIFNDVKIMKRKNAESDRQYREMISDFEEMARIFPDATLIIGSNNEIRWHNHSAGQLLNLQEPSRSGIKITSVIREPDFENWLSSSEDDRGNLTIHSPSDNNVLLELTAVDFRNSQRVLILRDVTEIHDTERLRRDLIANVSHELRTPLTVLLGYLEILQDQPKEAKPKAIRRMLKQARQMHALLEDLLELSRLQRMENQDDETDVDVPVLLAQLKEQALDISRGKHDLRFSVDPDLRIRGIEADLKSAFQNLIVNAINYTPDNGVIRVTWHETPEHLILSVRDNGIGIPYRDIPRLTERFYRVGDDRNRKTGGTGLGLAIVKHVLINHGAHLEISSEVSKGSEFTCLFPLSRKV